MDGGSAINSNSGGGSLGIIISCIILACSAGFCEKGAPGTGYNKWHISLDLYFNKFKKQWIITKYIQM